MEQIKTVMTDIQYHRESNCFLFATICHSIEQGWLLDTNRVKAYKLDQLVSDLCGVPTLQGKPKVLLIEQYGDSEYSALIDR